MLGGRSSSKEFLPYIVAQLLGAARAASLLSIIAGGQEDFDLVASGLGLVLIHLISIPVTNASVNPAHSISQAVFVGGWAIRQLWLFWVGPVVGAALAGLA